ncbi:MAG: AAA family ATPase [Anaerolineae bacterium]
MLIESVHLENVKSYERADATFAEGTNAICGPNGAGKSTLIEAIGFALFGSQRVRLEQLIRSGAGHGRIEVRFISSFDELSYHVVRDLRRAAASTVTLTSEDLGAVIATGVREVQDQLVQHLGLRPGVKLASLFEGVVGVPQGQLTYDFLLPPAPRKTRFEELLALQEFELAHQRLLGPVQHGRTTVATLQAGLAAMSEQLQALPDVEQHVEELQSQIVAVGAALAERDTAFRELRALRLRLDEAQVALLAAREQTTRAQSARDLSAQRLAEAVRRREEADHAAELAERAREAHDRYAELDAGVRAIEADLQKRDALRLEDHRLERDCARIEEALKQYAARIDEAGRAADRIAALQSSLSRQAELEAARVAAQDAVHAGRSAREQMDRLLGLRDAYRREEDVLRATLPPLQAASGRRDELAKARDEANAEVAALRADYARVRADAEAQKAALTAVTRGERQVCPSCRRPFEGGDVQGFIQHLTQQMHNRSAEAAAIEQSGMRARKSLDGIERRLAAAEEQAEQLRQNQAKLQAVQGLIASSQEQLREIEARTAPLAEHEWALADIDRELRALGDPRTACAALRPQADSLPGLTQETAQYQQRLDRHSRQRHGLAERLAYYAGLDALLVRAREQRDACRDGYDAFRRYVPLAADLPAREQEVGRRQSQADEAEGALAALAGHYEQLASAYDVAAHQDVRERERRLEIDAAEERSRLTGYTLQLADGREQLGRLRALEAQSAQSRQRLAEAESAVSALRVVRDAVRLAGPEIARRLLSRVSNAANRMFSEMMGDFAIELLWHNDYGITLRRGADERDFAQLSGGEQMTAALAVRLALLREISDVGVAFFDEPTANLDETRRQSLADQIRNIHDFRQLFVISHDDSLEGVTDNVIRVTKENGVSRIEQG